MTFIREHGLVRYTPHLGLKKLHSGQPCEACAGPSIGLDHCHVHGWIRGTLCGRCNQHMKAIDARKVGRHRPVLLEHWRNCPDCAESGPWSPGPAPAEQPYAGRRISVYLNDEMAAAWKASGLTLAQLVRRGLEVGEPIDDATLRRVLREELRGA